jgi:hypothetical protein
VIAPRFYVITVNALQYATWNLAGAKSLHADPLTKVLVRAGKFVGYGFHRQFDANFSLHRTQLIDVDFH